MKRSVLAVIAGAVVWSLCYQLTFPVLKLVAPDVWAATRIDHVPWLSLLLALTVGYSVLAGYVTAIVAKAHEVNHAVILGVLQLIMGTIAEVTFWETTPAWYHLIFLALLLPGNVYSAWLRQTSRMRTATHDPL